MLVFARRTWLSGVGYNLGDAHFATPCNPCNSRHVSFVYVYRNNVDRPDWNVPNCVEDGIFVVEASWFFS